MELETITEGYWPEGATLLHSDGGKEWEEGAVKAIRLHNCRAFYADGRTGFQWAHWAILPTKPTPRRLTNREVLALCRKGWDVFYNDLVGTTFRYPKNEDNIAIVDGAKLRAPGSDEWLEPTSDLMEATK